MVFDFRNQRQAGGGHAVMAWVGCFVVMGAMVAISSSATASIVLPSSPGLTLTDLEESMQSGVSSGSSAALAEEPIEDTREQGSEGLVSLMEITVPAGGSSSGTSTSGSGSSGPSASALDTVAAALLSDSFVAGWMSGERRLAVPMPPGNDLLRPPQAV